jgi:1-acyl-sn-glycerol-3-phosphate acyltransferase
MIATALAAVSRLIAGATVQWHCDPSSEAQRIYFGNHSSHLDFVVIWSALPPRLRRLTRPVAGRDYWEQGTVRRYLSSRVFRAVLIDRAHGGGENGVAAARASIQRMSDEMADRYSLIVFPEGTRSLTGEVGKFKSGLFHLSRLRPDAELIPVHLENLNRVLPKGEALPVPMLSRVVFGPRLEMVAGEDKQAFSARARDMLVQLKAG